MDTPIGHRRSARVADPVTRHRIPQTVRRTMIVIAARSLVTAGSVSPAMAQDEARPRPR